MKIHIVAITQPCILEDWNEHQSISKFRHVEDSFYGLDVQS